MTSVMNIKIDLTSIVPSIHTDDTTSVSRSSKHAKAPRVSVVEYPNRPYERCLDVGRTRAEYQNIRKRIWECHIVKADEICEYVKRRQQQKNKGVEEAVDDYCLESEVFGDVSVSERSKQWRPKTGSQIRKTAINSSTAARKLGLAKEDEFTGTEALALKNLLKTLRTKVWDPQLYFHIRFFSIRHKLLPMTLEEKTLVGVVLQWCIYHYMILNVYVLYFYIYILYMYMCKS